MENGNSLDRCGEVTTAAAMIAQDAPVLQASDGVLDARSAVAMATPRSIAHDPATAKHRCDELGYAAIATVGQDAAMLLAERLDRRTAVVDRVVAIAGPTGRGGDDPEIAPPDEDLRVA